MSGYSKLFSSIWTGSMYGRWKASAVFMVFLSLADRDGVVDMTPEAIAGLTGWPLELLTEAINELEQPDPRSRTRTHDGRRILRINPERDWGWIVTNYTLYRDKMRAQDRRDYLAEAQRRHRKSASTPVNSVNNVNQCQPIAEAAPAPTPEASKSKNQDIGQQADRDIGFEKFWKLYPKHVKKRESKKVWHAKRLETALQTILDDIRNRSLFDRRWKEGFIPDPPTYLRGERWFDEIDRSVKPVETWKLTDAQLISKCAQVGISTVGRSRAMLQAELDGKG